MKTAKKELLRNIERLERRAETLRQNIGVSKRSEILFQSPQSMWSDNDVVVEADGNGGAKLLIVYGNYPSDYSIKSERQFPTEADACNAADEIVERATNVPVTAL